MSLHYKSGSFIDQNISKAVMQNVKWVKSLLLNRRVCEEWKEKHPFDHLFFNKQKFYHFCAGHGKTVDISLKGSRMKRRMGPLESILSTYFAANKMYWI